MIYHIELDSGLRYTHVETAHASAKVALQGAHIFHYQRHDEAPLLWLSEASDKKPGTAIRGGIPVCWPWFGKPEGTDLPQHGFARTAMWKLVDSEESESSTKLVMEMEFTDAMRELWPYKTSLSLEVIISDTLEVRLTTTNLDEKPFELSQALHTYLTVSDISDIAIEGLDEKPYFDALTSQMYRQHGPLTFEQETDRVYQEVDAPLILKDTQRTVSVENSGSRSAVIWNPWIEKCSRMSGMNPDSYKTMVCIETANAKDDARTLDPGTSHTITAVIA
jgi:glucose-6-phosphate 1-epimerase